MKRSTHVAGLMEISGNGKCILELRQIAPSTVSESGGAASSNEMLVSDSAKLLGDVQSGVVLVHSTKNERNQEGYPALHQLSSARYRNTSWSKWSVE